MAEIHVIENVNDRIDTGVIQFKGKGMVDWPGVFIRGDHAAYLVTCLKSMVDLVDESKLQMVDAIAINSVNQLIELLESSRV